MLTTMGSAHRTLLAAALTAITVAGLVAVPPAPPAAAAVESQGFAPDRRSVTGSVSGVTEGFDSATVGLCDVVDGCAEGSEVRRLAWQFDDVGLRYSYQLLEAVFSARLVLQPDLPSGSCKEYSASVYSLGSVAPTDAWDGRSAWPAEDLLNTQWYTAPGCGDASSDTVTFDVTEVVRAELADGLSPLTFGLTAADESCVECAHAFSGGAWLFVDFNRPPGAVTEVQVLRGFLSPLACGEQPVTTAGIVGIAAAVTDPDRDWVRLRVRVVDETTGQEVYRQDGSTSATKWAQVWFRLPAGAYTAYIRPVDDPVLSTRVPLEGPEAVCRFVVDFTEPGIPQITPALGYAGVYPAGQERGGPGVPGAFLVTPTGSDDVVKYLYGSPYCNYGREIAASGPVLIPFTPTSSGPGSFSVCAVDRAGNMSGDARATFDVAYELTSSPAPVAVEIPAEAAAGSDLIARLTLSADATYAHGAVTVAVDGVTVGTTTFDEMTETVNLGRLARGERQVAFTYRATPGSPPTTITKKVVVGQQLQVSAHVQSIGWQTPVADGQVAGTTGRGLRVEALRFSLAGQGYSGGVEASAHVESYGWLPFAGTGGVIGTTGESKRVEAFKIRLTGELAEQYDVYYRTHAENFGWLGWAKNGESSGTAGYGYRLEAVQVQLVAKGGPAPDGSSGPAFHESSKAANQRVSVAAHVQNIGWMAPVAGGQTAGTEGRGLRVEALRFGVGGDVPGGIEASAHVQNVGWQPFAGTSGLVGTEGQGLRVEAFRIRLTGQLAEKYDVYYRTHAQNFGWLGWAKNGEDSGTAGYAYRLESVQVLLVPKGGPAPSGTGTAFHQR